jgi:hypothetical protein
LEYKLLVTQLLLKRRISPTGLTHQQTQHPQKKTKFHVHSLKRKMNGRRSVAASDDNDTIGLCLQKMMQFLASMTAKSRFSTDEATPI